jgi:hypothetical protein
LLYSYFVVASVEDDRFAQFLEHKPRRRGGIGSAK